jgi:ABC-type glycerol-3-phosphate transport system permease component
MLRDFRRSFEYYFANPPELVFEMARWWGGQDVQARYGVMALLAICAIYAFFYFRPAFGSFLSVFFPYSWINTHRMRSLFFTGTKSEFERTWRKKGQPTNARWRYILDLLYYLGPMVVVLVALAVCFIVLVGYPSPLDR